MKSFLKKKLWASCPRTVKQLSSLISLWSKMQDCWSFKSGSYFFKIFAESIWNHYLIRSWSSRTAWCCNAREALFWKFRLRMDVWEKSQVESLSLTLSLNIHKKASCPCKNYLCHLTFTFYIIYTDTLVPFIVRAHSARNSMWVRSSVKVEAVHVFLRMHMLLRTELGC